MILSLQPWLLCILKNQAKNYIIPVLLLVSGNTAHAQRFFSVVFNQLPQDYQLYPRNEKNEAAVPVSGFIEIAGYSYMSIQVFRNDTLVKYIKAPVKYDGKGTGSFSAETSIKAELAQYDFTVHACKAADSALIVTRKNVVAGDVYIVMGQSNSTGFFQEKETSPYARTFGKITGTLNTEAYNSADTLWSLSNTSEAVNVGTMGLEIQKQLSQKYGVPNCLINGGFHWSSAYGHALRNESNPADLNTAYGRMLYRLQKSGLRKSAKAFIYRQGETEMYNEGFEWEKYFGMLRDHLKLDLPALQKIYVFQVDIIYYPSMVGAELRDYQRRLPQIYPEIRALATVGTAEFDGLHYGPAGNKQSGFELSRLIGRDFYGLKDTLNIDSPSVKKVYYKNAEKKELVLVFDEGQQLVYPAPYRANDNVTLNMKDFFYLNEASGAVTAGSAQENRIALTLNNTQNATEISYLPPFVREGNAYYPFNGPYVTNKLGMRAFTFHKVQIVNALSTPVLTAKTEGTRINLGWNAIADAAFYQLDRRTTQDTTWKRITVLAAPTVGFKDEAGNLTGKIFYRLRAVSNVSESAAFAFAEVENQVITAIEEQKEDAFTAYPNPLKKHENLTVNFPKPVSGTLLLFDKNGKKLYQKEIKRQSAAKIRPTDLPQGYYFLRFDSDHSQFTKKIFITH